jgi:hypothetical protein
MSRLALVGLNSVIGEAWVRVTGTLEGDELRVGDEVTLAVDGVNVTTAIVRAVESYSPPHLRTIAVDATVANLLY